MIIYHGSDCCNIENFEFGHSRQDLDFGEGIYFTTSFEQAKSWSCRNSTRGAVYECDIDFSALNVLRLEGKANEDLAYTLYLCRIKLEDVAKDAIDNFAEADVICGELLGGRIKKFKKDAERFNKGDISYEEYRSRMKLYNNTNDQICIKSDYALQLVNNSLLSKYLTEKRENKIYITHQEILKAR